MRWVSAGVLCSSSRDIDGDLIPKMQKQFIYQLPKHIMHTTDDGTNVLVFWDKIAISEDTDMHQKTREIEDALNTRNLIIVDFGEDPKWYTKHGGLIGIIIAIVGMGIAGFLHWLK